jgi:mono/diheme cytochrome c family protein
MNRRLFALLVACFLPIAAPAEDRYAPWVQADFPFFGASLDLRAIEPEAKPFNVVPRGLVLNLGHDCWACFDTELLRVAAVWQGKGVTPEALGPLTWQDTHLKTLVGQEKLPKPDGEVWLMNGVYPGWQTGATVSLDDPRPAETSAEEPGRGPLPHALFKAVRLGAGGVVLEYNVADTAIEEWITYRRRSPGDSADGSGEPPVVQRNFRIAPGKEPLVLVLAKNGVSTASFASSSSSVAVSEGEHAWSARVPAREQAVEFAIAMSKSAAPQPAGVAPRPGRQAARWSQTVTTKPALSTATDAYVMDDIPLPMDNPWRCNIRFCDIAFLKDGTAVGSAFDGDVWIARGLAEKSGNVQWRRFASGLHEPMSLVVRDEEIFVFDRLGIWRLRDTDADSEADVHELFSNVFPQSGETREFPNSLKLAPDGSFIVAKGGQQASTISRLNGSVLRVAPDGQNYTVLGVGFRQPYAGVHPRTGLVTASDQEGHYTPTTPLYIVKDAEYHGYLSELLPREKYPAPIAEPLTWIPHTVNPSAVSQVWLAGAKLGPLNDALIHVGFNRPELFRVLMNERTKRPQAAVVSVLRDFDVPALNATVNPVDGCLYVTGFQLVGWGTTAKKLSALGRLRHTGGPSTVPRELVPMDKGVLLRFDVALDPATATDPASYSLESWGYRRTYQYGSPHLKADGTPGQDWIVPSSAYLAKDGRSVFVGVPGMKRVMQMRIGWSLAIAGGAKFSETAYFTPHELVKFDPVADGFEPFEVDLTPRAAAPRVTQAASAEEGERIYKMMGCMACHAADDSKQPKIGPSWRGLYGSQRQLVKAPPVTADEAYLREAILTPAATIVKGFEKVEAGMPQYAGVLTDAQVESIILFIKTLK